MEQHIFPWGIYIGDFINEDNESAAHIPVLLPAETGGFCVVYDEKSEAVANNLIENTAFEIARVLPPQSVEFHVFDFGHKKRFSWLFMLQSHKLYHIALNSDAAARAFNRLEALSQHRHHELLSPKTPTLREYNAVNTYPEPYHILLIHLEYYPDDFAGYLRLKSFFDAAAEAGIYTILFVQEHTENLEKNTNRAKCLDYLHNRFPKLHIRDKQVQLNDDLFAFSKLKQWYDFIPPDSNRESILAGLEAALQEDDPAASRKDFLSVPVAVSQDGRQSFDFALGDHAQNYHAFITGQTGSGKTVLLNNLIVGIARKYTADELRLYLMDYKQGVEFSIFRDHPNCEKLFLDETDFSLAAEMINEFADTIRQRSTLLKQAPGFKDIDEYNCAYPQTPLPYQLLIIDEAQRLFSGSYQQKEYFIKNLDFVLREGRSFGLHIILATQTLAGSGVDKNLMSQIQLRISFKLGRQVDAESILDFRNDAPLHLDNTRFELVINTDAGKKGANTICRANPPLDIRTELSRIRASRASSQMIRPVVVEGQDTRSPDNFAEQAPEQQQASVHKEADNTLPWQNQDLYETDTEANLLKELKEKGITPRTMGE